MPWRYLVAKSVLDERSCFACVISNVESIGTF